MWTLPCPLQLTYRPFLGQAFHDYQGFRLEPTSMILSRSFRDIKRLFEAVNYHATSNGMDIKPPKHEVMSALTPGEQCQTVYLDNKPLTHFDIVTYLGCKWKKHQRVRMGIYFAHSAFSGLRLCLWSRSEIWLQLRNVATMRSLWKAVGGLWQWQHPCILRVRRRDCVPSVELR